MSSMGVRGALFISYSKEPLCNLLNLLKPTPFPHVVFGLNCKDLWKTIFF